MSAWGGIDLDDDSPEASVTSLYNIDAEEVLQRAEADPEATKQELQRVLVEASQNGDSHAVHDILGSDKLRELVGIDVKDEAGSTPLIYASCFGHEEVVSELLRFDAQPDLQDKNEWTALMWAVNNNHLAIVKQLLAADADVSIKTSSGRGAFDLPSSSSSATYLYLSSQGYIQDKSGSGDTAFYQEAIDPNEADAKFDAELRESARALGGFGASESSALAYNAEDEDASLDDIDSNTLELSVPARNTTFEIIRDFDWDTFKIKDSLGLPRESIPAFLDFVVSNITPTLQKNQIPASANALFLVTRYFFFCGNSDSFAAIVSPLGRRIELAIQDEKHSGDLAYLSYWLANTEVLLYYMRRDRRLGGATQEDIQRVLQQLVRIISSKIQEAAHKLLKPLIEPCLLDYDSIPEYGSVKYRDEWKLFRSSSKVKDDREDVAQKRVLPPTPETLFKKPGPQRVTSVLSSLLLLFQIYSVHPVTQSQIIAKLIYYMSSRMFNKIVSNRKYLNRRRAMQVRLNVSVIEDWCRNQSFRPNSVDIDGKTYRYKSLVDIGRTFLAPLVQMLAWLQTFSGFGSDFTNVISTLQELKSLNPKQLLQTATHYRFETRESPLSKEYKHYLQDLSRHYDRTAAENMHQKEEPQSQAPPQLDGVESLITLDQDDSKLNAGTAADTGSSGPSQARSCVLVSYELPVADEVLLNEDLPLFEHIPDLAEGLDFWGGEGPTGYDGDSEHIFVPFVPSSMVESIAKIAGGEGGSDSRNGKDAEGSDANQWDTEEPSAPIAAVNAGQRDVDEADDASVPDTDPTAPWGDADEIAPVWT